VKTKLDLLEQKLTNLPANVTLGLQSTKAMAMDHFLVVGAPDRVGMEHFLLKEQFILKNQLVDIHNQLTGAPETHLNALRFLLRQIYSTCLQIAINKELLNATPKIRTEGKAKLFQRNQMLKKILETLERKIEAEMVKTYDIKMSDASEDKADLHKAQLKAEWSDVADEPSRQEDDQILKELFSQEVFEHQAKLQRLQRRAEDLGGSSNVNVDDEDGIVGRMQSDEFDLYSLLDEVDRDSFGFDFVKVWPKMVERLERIAEKRPESNPDSITVSGKDGT